MFFDEKKCLKIWEILRNLAIDIEEEEIEKVLNRTIAIFIAKILFPNSEEISSINIQLFEEILSFFFEEIKENPLAKNANFSFDFLKKVSYFQICDDFLMKILNKEFISLILSKFSYKELQVSKVILSNYLFFLQKTEKKSLDFFEKNEKFIELLLEIVLLAKDEEIAILSMKILGFFLHNYEEKKEFVRNYIEFYLKNEISSTILFRKCFLEFIYSFEGNFDDFFNKNCEKNTVEYEEMNLYHWVLHFMKRKNTEEIPLLLKKIKGFEQFFTIFEHFLRFHWENYEIFLRIFENFIDFLLKNSEKGYKKPISSRIKRILPLFFNGFKEQILQENCDKKIILLQNQLKNVFTFFLERKTEELPSWLTIYLFSFIDLLDFCQISDKTEEITDFFLQKKLENSKNFEKILLCLLTNQMQFTDKKFEEKSENSLIYPISQVIFFKKSLIFLINRS